MFPRELTFIHNPKIIFSLTILENLKHYKINELEIYVNEKDFFPVIKPDIFDCQIMFKMVIFV